MTTLLEKAYSQTKKLPDATQDLIAKQLLALLDLQGLIEATQEEDILKIIQDELMWNVQFARSQDLLEKMANEALEDLRNGETELLDIDKL